MKKGITSVFLAISTFAVAQSYNFKPEWKKGDERTVYVTQVEKEYENGTLISDTTISYEEALITITKSTKQDYTVEVQYDNQVLKSVGELYEELGEKLSKYQRIKLIYSVDKQTGASDLKNWEEIRDYVNGSFDDITSVLEEGAPESTPFLSALFNPFKEIFSSKENIEAYMEDHIGYMLTPYNRDFKVGETLSVVEAGENPFNPSQTVETTTHLTLKNIDEDSKVCTINQNIEIDLSEFVNMIKGMVQEMSKSFGADDSITDEKMKELDDFEMDMINQQTIVFNYQTSWVNEVIAEATVISTDPRGGKKKKKEVITTRVLK